MNINKNTNIIQGSFPGGKPHASVLLQTKLRKYNVGSQSVYPIDFNKMDLTSPGKHLPEKVLQKMESVFKTNFSQVRIHSGREAESIGALAFTSGHDIYFATGQYNPNTPHGQRLLGHELTHVVQQKNGRVSNPFEKEVAVVNDFGLEAEAERMSQYIYSHYSTKASLISPKQTAPPRILQSMWSKGYSKQEMTNDESEVYDTSYNTTASMFINNDEDEMDYFGKVMNYSGNHAEDQIFSYLSKNENKLSKYQRNEIVIYLSKSPCTSTKRKSNKDNSTLPVTSNKSGNKKGCTEVLLDMVNNGIKGYKFKISLIVQHLYQPKKSGAKNASRAALRALSANKNINVSLENGDFGQDT